VFIYGRADTDQHCHRGIPDRAEFWRPQTLGYQFLAEAKRLWEVERENGLLTTVQAGVIICALSNANGVDKVGWSYLVQAVAIARQLQLFSKGTATTSKKAHLAHSFTAWGMFSYQR